MNDVTERRMLNLTDLADFLGQNKGQLSKRISKLEAEGKLKPTYVGQFRMIDVDEYERVTAAEMSHQKANSAARRQAATAAAGEGTLPLVDRAAKTLTEANVENAQLRAEMAKIDLAERRGQVLAVTDVSESMIRCAGVITRVIDQFPNRAPEVFNAALTGERGVRTVLRTMATELRETIAREMTVLVDEGRAREAEGPRRVDMDLMLQPQEEGADAISPTA